MSGKKLFLLFILNIFIWGAYPLATQAQISPIELDATLDNSYIIEGEDGDLYLVIDIKGKPTKIHKRAAVNLSIVLDRSGSMYGAPIANAKKSAINLVANMKKGAILSVIAFSTNVSVILPATRITSTNQDYIISRIQEIESTGATNMSDGMLTGYMEIQKNSLSADVNRVIVISDGVANMGITNPIKLGFLAKTYATNGIKTSTIGVGVEYNEDTMTNLAEFGGGNYYYLKDASYLSSAFLNELYQIEAIVGKNTTVNIELEPDVDLDEVYGYKYDQKGKNIKIMLHDYFGGQKRKIVTKLRYKGQKRGMLKVAKVQMHYLDVSQKQNVALRRTLSIKTTNSPGLKKNSVNQQVLKQVYEVKTANSMNTAMDYFKKGDVKNAKQVLSTQIEQLRKSGLMQDKNFSGGQKLQKAYRTLYEAPASSSKAKHLIKEHKKEAYDMLH